MFRTLLLIWPAMLLALLIGCSDSGTNSTVGDLIPDDTLGLNDSDTAVTGGDGRSQCDTHIIRYGHAASVDQNRLSVKFTGPIDDGRCPIGLHCFWEGQAIIQLALTTADGQSGTISLIRRPGHDASDPGSPYAVEAFGYRFGLLALDPYPVWEQYTPPWKYRATVKIERLDYTGDSPVVISDAVPWEICRTAYELVDASADGDRLTLSVRYGGGCGEHFFQMFMSPSVFMESEPVQANLYLQHVTVDFCLAYLSGSVSFDLTPVAQLYRAMYGRDGQILLNVVPCSSSDDTLQVLFDTQ